MESIRSDTNSGGRLAASKLNELVSIFSRSMGGLKAFQVH